VNDAAPTTAQTVGPAAFGWRWIFPLVSLVAALAVPFLAREASDAVLSSTGGIEVTGERVDDPAAAGYLAFVVASPTAIVFDIDEDDRLVGAAFIGLSGSAGGRVLAVPAELAVEPEPGALETLALAYEGGGVERARNGFERMLGISVDSVFEMSPADRAAAMQPALPVEYSLVTSLEDEDGNPIFARGRLELDESAALDVVSALGPNEFGYVRADRQRALWETWIEEVGRQLAAAGLEIEEHDLGSPSGYVEALASGIHRVDLIPAEQALIGEGKPFYLADETYAPAVVADLVVFPELFEDTRPSVQVENGTTDQSLHDVAADAVEQGGGKVVVISNAFALDVAETVVAVHDPAYVSTAQSVAAQLGGVPVEVVAEEEADVDIVVIIGADLVEAPS